MTLATTPLRVSRAQRSMKCNAMLRCRPGTVANAAYATIPDQRCTASLRCALHRIRETLIALALALLLTHPAAAQPRGKPGAIVPAPAAPAAPAPAAPANGVAPDLAFGAFQRGEFLTAFRYATERVETAGDAKSMTLLAELYANGLGVAADDGKAAEWYRLAAARGDANAMFALAMFALAGRAGPRDREASAKWLAAAAKLGHPQAAYDLGLLYIEGQLFPQDFKRAAELFRVAAAAGSADAQYALGTFYKEGRGVPQDAHEAARLWAAAALADNTDAEVEYAIALYNGDGVSRDQAAAAALFRKAALAGSAIAQDRLARILSSGKADQSGAPPNAVEAIKWHLISRAGGETDLELDAYMDRADAATRDAAEKAAKPWLDAIAAAQAARAHAAAQGPPATPLLGQAQAPAAPGAKR